ncbi:MAG TPA: hypothetical protein VHX92_00690 [Rhizomicrobium sp.]|nr:hypothetical protein [Rhizomicrobium sp.]
MKARIASAKERSSGWRLVACLILVAFTLQSYITQTHIHNVAPAATAKITPLHGNAPVDDNPVDCPFCQAVAHDGPFFAPAVPLLILSIEFVELAAPALRFHRSWDAPAHIWQSRAPPHH